MKFIILFLLGIGLYLYLKNRKEIETWVDETVEEVTDMLTKGYDEIYRRWGELRQLDWRLIKAVAIVESSERAEVVGDDGQSIGLMQVSRVVGASYGMTITDLFDPNLNVQAGSGFLAEMINRYGLEGGIQAYNLGETKYRKGLRSPTYLSKVMTEFNKLQQIV